MNLAVAAVNFEAFFSSVLVFATVNVYLTLLLRVLYERNSELIEEGFYLKCSKSEVGIVKILECRIYSLCVVCAESY
jgi:hypothetical protein